MSRRVRFLRLALLLFVWVASLEAWRFLDTQDRLHPGHEGLLGKTETIAEIVASKLRRNEPIEAFTFKSIFNVDANIGYVIVDNRSDGFRTGMINDRAMSQAPDIIRLRTANTDFHTLANQLMEPGQGGSTPGFNVLQLELRDRRKPAAPARALVKLGYLASAGPLDYMRPYVGYIPWMERAALGLMLMLLVFSLAPRSAKARASEAPVVLKGDKKSAANKERTGKKGRL